MINELQNEYYSSIFKRLSMIITNLKYIISNKQNLGCCKEHQKELDKQYHHSRILF